MWMLALILVIMVIGLHCQECQNLSMEHMGRGRGHPRLVRSRHKQYSNLFYPQPRTYFPQYQTQYEENALNCMNTCLMKDINFQDCIKFCKDLYPPNVIII